MGFFPIGTGNAVPSDVLTGTSFSSGTLPAGATGNIPDQGSPTITPSGNNAIALSAGYYTGGSVSQVSVPASQVLTGTTIAGVAGTMPNRGAPTWTPTTSNQALSAGYYTGGTVQGDSNLVTGNIRSGVSIFGVAGDSNVVDTSSATAVAANIFTGYTAFVAGSKITGTMPNATLSSPMVPGTTNQGIPAGYHAGNGNDYVEGDANLAAGNIKSGVSIFGVSGNVIQASGSATAAQILNGVTASNNSGPVTGTMPNNGNGGTITPGTSNQSIASGYWATANTVSGDANLVAGNIKSGVGIFGVSGNVIQASGDAGAAQVLSGYSASNSGGGFSGSMSNNGSPTVTPNGVSQNLGGGYYAGITVNSVGVKVATGPVTAFAPTENFIEYGGSTVSFPGATISVPSGLTKVIMVIISLPENSPPTNTTPGLSFVAASPSGYMDGNTASILAQIITYDTTSSVLFYSIIAGGALSLSPSSIVVPVPPASSGTFYYSLLYV